MQDVENPNTSAEVKKTLDTLILKKLLTAFFGGPSHFAAKSMSGPIHRCPTELGTPESDTEGTSRAVELLTRATWPFTKSSKKILGHSDPESRCLLCGISDERMQKGSSGYFIDQRSRGLRRSRREWPFSEKKIG